MALCSISGSFGSRTVPSEQQTLVVPADSQWCHKSWPGAWNSAQLYDVVVPQIMAWGLEFGTVV